MVFPDVVHEQLCQTFGIEILGRGYMVSFFSESINNVADSILAIYLCGPGDEINTDISPALLWDRERF